MKRVKTTRYYWKKSSSWLLVMLLVLRFSGFWQLLGRGEDSNSTGTLVYLVEHRHRYTDNLPQTLASENFGYAGFIGIPFGNEGGLHLTN